MAENKKTVKVKVYELANRLRLKIGRDPKSQEEGYIAEEAIAEADKLIEALCAQCPATISAHLETLNGVWAKMRDMQEGAERESLTEQVFTISHEIKDVASMCGFTLIAYFAESLRDYIDRTELNLKAQRVIVQAHIDAMNTTHKQGLKDEGGPLADELKALVKIAVDKYK